MKKTKNIFALLVMALAGLTLASCGEDDLDTNQYLGGVSLNAYGPNPVMRGGTLRYVSRGGLKLEKAIEVFGVTGMAEGLHMNDMAAKIVIQFIVLALNYVFSKFLVFTRAGGRKKERSFKDE